MARSLFWLVYCQPTTPYRNMALQFESAIDWVSSPDSLDRGSADVRALSYLHGVPYTTRKRLLSN